MTNLTHKLMMAESLIEEEKDLNRSAWNRGVKTYALELIADLEERAEGGYLAEDDLCNPRMIQKAMLCGASDWGEYSWGGCSLIYDKDIAERLCNPSELKRTDHGRKDPNSRESWLDVQKRALYQACGWATIAVDACVNP